LRLFIKISCSETRFYLFISRPAQIKRILTNTEKFNAEIEVSLFAIVVLEELCLKLARLNLRNAKRMWKKVEE